MESFTPYLIGAVIAILVGLDRTSALQMMISRPLVAGPLTGFVLGDVRTGLTIGMLLELLWLCRMPVGASIPYDDTQAAVGATTLTIALSNVMGKGLGLTLCVLLVVLPLGKIGQVIERKVRSRNLRLTSAAQNSLHQGKLPAIERLHLFGLVNFALGALLIYAIIVVVGRWLVMMASPFFFGLLTIQSEWIKVALILVGVGSLLQSLNVRRAHALFFCGFLFCFLLRVLQ